MRKFCLVFLLCSFASAQAPPGTPPVTGTPQPAILASPEFAHPRQLLQGGHYDEAIAELQKLSATQPVIKGLAHELGMAYYKKGDYIRAIASFKLALQQNSADSEATQLLGLSFYLSGRPSDALPLLEKVQNWFPRANVDASYILGQCYIQTKDYPNARRAFAKMFSLPSDSAASYLLTARMLFRQEFEPVALEYAKQAIALDSHLPLAHFLMGQIHLFQSQIPEAISDFQQELELNPAHAETYYKMADAYSRAEKFDDAERLLQRSIWLDPTSTGPYVLLGKVLEKKGEPELAVRALRHAASMDPNNSVTHHLLGQAYRDLGNGDEAERELNFAGKLESAPDSTP